MLRRAFPYRAVSPPRTLTLILLTGLAVLTLNMFLPSLPAIAAEFGVSYAHISWAVSGYFALTAVLQLVIGPMSDRFGRRPLLLIGAGVFTAASLVCALAETASVFLAARMVQCAVVTCSALPAAIVRDTNAPADAARMLGLIGGAMALAPMLGPLVGGLTEAVAGWRASFALYALFGLVALALIWTDVGETNAHRGRAMAEQFRGYPDILGSARFWANAACLMFSSSTFFVFLAGAPLAGAAGFGLTPAGIGLAMAVTPLGFMLGNFATARLTARVPLARLMVIGRAITVAGLALLLAALPLDPPVWLYFGLMIGVGIGNGLSFPPAYTGVMSVRPDLAGTAAGLAGSMMVGLGAVTTALAARFLTPANAVGALALAMFVTASCALLAAIAARRAEIRAERAPALAAASRPASR